MAAYRPLKEFKVISAALDHILSDKKERARLVEYVV